LTGAAALALALAAQAAGPTAEPYRAEGIDPVWSLTIADGRMTYESPGRTGVSVNALGRQVHTDSVHYQARGLEVTIYHDPCDGAEGRRYADHVFVTVGRAEHSGCGGALLPADSLDGTSWHFAEIGGEDTGLTGDIFRDDRYAIDFGADGFVGYGGCNRFSAGYSRSGDTLTIRPPLGFTGRRCPEPIMHRELRLMQILSEPMRVGFPDDRTMVLTGPAGTIRLSRTPRTGRQLG
jgi:heat shock protein HslJ